MHGLITAAEARAADEAAVDAGASWDGLMATAGHGLAMGVVDELRGRTGGVYGRGVVLVAGKGDNGGDAWVAARVLRDRGVAATVVATHGADVATSDHSARARAAWIGTGGRVVEGVDGLAPLLGPDDDPTAVPAVVVDAVLGTGVRGAARGVAASAIAALRHVSHEATAVVAADLPSGLEADTGRAAGGVVRARRTVTFGARKRGLALHPGASYAGRVDTVRLTPDWGSGLRDHEGWAQVTDHDVRVAPLADGDDKTHRGRVLVVAGSRRYAGAGALAAAAALRTGAGLVTLATTAPATAVHALEPGVMVVPLPAADPADDDGAGGPAPGAADVVAALAADADVVVLGPGCGHGPGTRAVADVLLAADVGLVLDADGLNVFRGDAAALRGHRGLLVLTPHHRELARLLGRDDPDDVLAARHEVVPALAEDLGVVVVGKGPRTVVAGPGRVRVVSSGGPALGSGGSGDVLAGLLGARLASSGPRPTGGEAAGSATGDVARAVQLHGMLGDVAGAAAADRATARDLLEVLPRVLADRAADGDRTRPRVEWSTAGWR